MVLQNGMLLKSLSDRCAGLLILTVSHEIATREEMLHGIHRTEFAGYIAAVGLPVAEDDTVTKHGIECLEDQSVVHRREGAQACESSI
jgi:hypothetical protein